MIIFDHFKTFLKKSVDFKQRSEAVSIHSYLNAFCFKRQQPLIPRQVTLKCREAEWNTMKIICNGLPAFWLAVKRVIWRDTVFSSQSPELSLLLFRSDYCISNYNFFFVDEGRVLKRNWRYFKIMISCPSASCYEAMAVSNGKTSNAIWWEKGWFVIVTFCFSFSLNAFIKIGTQLRPRGWILWPWRASIVVYLH